jgi:hypothetical protein
MSKQKLEVYEVQKNLLSYQQNNFNLRCVNCIN